MPAMTRGEIEQTIERLQEAINAEAVTASQKKIVMLFAVGLDLLCNFLGDISDIALNNRRQHEDSIAYKAKMAIEEANRGL